MTAPQRKIFENPANGASDDSRVWANLDPVIHKYFFRQVLAGSIGAKQSLINTFFAKLHEACLADGITPEWSLENEFAVRDILKKLNFSNGTGQSSRTRRANNPTSKRKKQPASRSDEPGATNGPRQKATKSCDVGSDPDR